MHQLSRKGIFLFVLFCAISVAAGEVFAAPAPPSWMPGFPMRMGENVMLMWMPVPGASGYKIMKTEEGKPEEVLAKPTANNHMDAAAPSSKTFTYTVIAVAADGESAPSPKGTVAGIKPLAAPTGLTGRHVEGTGISIRWTPVDGAAFYNVTRKAPGESEFKLVTSSQEARFSDTQVEEGNTYEYKVSAVSAASVASPASEPFSIEIKKVVKAVVKKFDFLGVKMELVKDLVGEQGYEMSSPGEMAWDPVAKRLYVNDANGSVQFFDEEGEFVGRLGFAPDPSQINSWGRPQSMALDGDKNLWVIYRNPKSIRLIDTNTGDPIASFKYDVHPEFLKVRPGTEWSPANVLVDPKGRIWVSDGMSNQIIIVEYNGKEYAEVKRIGAPVITKEIETDESKILRGPTAMILGPDGKTIWVAEALSGNIKAFDIEGNYVKYIGGRGPSLSNFSGLQGLAFDTKGNILGSDSVAVGIRALNPANGDYVYSLINDEKEKKYTLPIPVGIVLIGGGEKLFIAHPIDGKVSMLKVYK